MTLYTPYMNNPGTRLTLQLLHTLLTEKKPLENPGSHPDLLDSQGQPLFSPSTLSRTITLLEEEGWIIQHKTGKEAAYIELSSDIKSLLCSYTSSFSSSLMVAPMVESLAMLTGESAAFAIWKGNGITFTAKQEMPESFHYIPLKQVNRFNFHNGFNVTCLAYMDSTTRAKLFNEPQTQSLFTTIEDVEKITIDILNKGYLYWEDNAARITAPVFYPDSILAGVIGISFFNKKYTDSQLQTMISQVKAAAGEITRSLNR